MFPPERLAHGLCLHHSWFTRLELWLELSLVYSTRELQVMPTPQQHTHSRASRGKPLACVWLTAWHRYVAARAQDTLCRSPHGIATCGYVLILHPHPL